MQQIIQLKRDVFNIWFQIHPKIREKFNNLNGKTGRYQVPEKLFQDRTSRQNRVLLPWKVLLKNKMTVEHLKTFYGGVCVEFINNDIFNSDCNETFEYLKNKIGSDDMISAIISFRTEDGDPGATVARASYENFRNNQNYDNKPIERNPHVNYTGRGDNSVWYGNIFISIKGGDQTSVESHSEKQQLFNPATEYANEQVCLDMDLLMSFFAMHCFDIKKKIKNINEFNSIKNQVENYLKGRNYDEGNLYEYAINHPILKYGSNVLVDPVRLYEISISDFHSDKGENSCVISHNIAANKDKFYFDNINQCILSPARPTNLFWSSHLSNMMQQNYTLEEFYIKLDEWSEKRKSIV